MEATFVLEIIVCMKSTPHVVSSRPRWLPCAHHAGALEWPSTPPNLQDVPLLGQAEKAELEKLILERFEALYGKEGGSALLHPDLRVVVNARGVELDHGGTQDALTAVEVKTLFTALCYATGGTASLPQEALHPLATEATSAAAAAINRLSPG